MGRKLETPVETTEKLTFYHFRRQAMDGKPLNLIDDLCGLNFNALNQYSSQFLKEVKKLLDTSPKEKYQKLLLNELDILRKLLVHFQTKSPNYIKEVQFRLKEKMRHDLDEYGTWLKSHDESSRLDAIKKLTESTLGKQNDSETAIFFSVLITKGSPLQRDTLDEVMKELKISKELEHAIEIAYEKVSEVSEGYKNDKEKLENLAKKASFVTDNDLMIWDSIQSGLEEIDIYQAKIQSNLNSTLD